MDSQLQSILKCQRFHFEECDKNRFVPKNGTHQSLEEQMLADKNAEIWRKCASQFGQFLARFCCATRLAGLTDEEIKSLQINISGEKTRLKNWLETNLADRDDSILSVIMPGGGSSHPSKQLKCCLKDAEENLSRAKSVGSNLQQVSGGSSTSITGAAAPTTSSTTTTTQAHHHPSLAGLRSEEKILLAKKALQILNDQKFCLIMQNARADSVFLLDENDLKVIIFPEYGITVGPLSLQLSINLADFFVLYYTMRRKFYVADVTLAQICHEIGKSFKETAENVLSTKIVDSKFWQEVSLLTGWEILRRLHTQDNVCFDMEESDGCFQAALRLINASDHIETIGSLTFIGFALC